MNQLSSFSGVMDAENHLKNRAMGAVNHSKNRAMEADTISKHGRSSKSQTSRGNFVKRTLLSAVCFIVLSSVCFAQDIIVTKDAKRINAKITEVNVDNVRYKNFDNQDGPVYTLLKSEIASIIYQNGQVETFGSETRYQQPQLGNQQGKPTGKYKSPSLAWTLSFLVPGVGQFYNGQPVKGVVFLTSNIVGYSLLTSSMLGKNYSEDNAAFAAIVVVSWVWSQIDAPINAKKKNRANGFVSCDLGNGGAYLALEPEYKLTPIHVSQGVTLAPTYGVGLKLKF